MDVKIKVDDLENEMSKKVDAKGSRRVFLETKEFDIDKQNRILKALSGIFWLDKPTTRNEWKFEKQVAD
jgi:hypothetical protein